MCLLLLAPNPAAPAKPEPVKVVVEHGTFLPHQGTARLKITVEPNRENRYLVTSIDSDDFSASSLEELRGAAAAKTRWIEFKDLPDGYYVAEVRLQREHGEVGDSTTFSVGQPITDDSF